MFAKKSYNSSLPEHFLLAILVRDGTKCVLFNFVAQVIFLKSYFNIERSWGPVVTVNVRDNNVDQALKALKKKMQREGIFREMKLRKNYEKPSEKKAREKSEAIRRARKMDRKRRDRD